MKDIVAHCDKTIVKTEDNIKDTETHLKNITEREEYQSVDKTIQNNEANSYNKESSKSSIIWNTNKIQQQRKHRNPLNIKLDFKKYMHVLYKELKHQHPCKYHWEIYQRKRWKQIPNTP